MAKIIDPDLLVRSSTFQTLGTDGNIWIDTTQRMIFLAPYVAGGDVEDDLNENDGVTVQALYSFLKEEWKDDSNLIKFPFPMVAITPEQFEFVDQWQPANMDTVYLFKDGGFAVKNAAGESTSEFPCMITLGSLGATDQVYYQQTADGFAKDIHLEGAVNQCVKCYGITSGTTIGFAPDEPAQVMSNIGIATGTPVDLSADGYYLKVTVDGYVADDIDLGNSASTTLASIVSAINTAVYAASSNTVGYDSVAEVLTDYGSSGYDYIRITGIETTNGNYIIVEDGTSTVNSTMALFSQMGGIMMDEAGDHIYSTGGMITTFHPGEVVAVTGSTSNDGNYVINSIRSDYTRMTTHASDDALTTEAPGASVTIEADARSYFKIFTREYQKSYAQAELDDIGITTMTYQAYRFPLANATDLKITHDDSTVSTTLPYTDMDITYLNGNILGAVSDITYAVDDVVQEDNGTGSQWFICTGAGTVTGSSGVAQGSWGGTATWASYTGERQIGDNYYAFNVVIDADAAGDGNLPTAEEIYEFIQYSLRQNSDIDENGTVIGKTADLLLSFVGDTLVTEAGVYIDDFSETDINRLEFYDYAGVKRTFPFVAAGTINFNDNLTSDSGPVFSMFFTNTDAADVDNGYDFGTANAIIVKDNDLADISGAVTGASIQFTYDYDGNTQRGAGSDGEDAPVTIVAIGLDKAQYVKTSGTIGRSNANTFSLVASLERNYSNPA